MFDHTCAEAQIKPDFLQNFWKAIDIYLFKTHVLNKKLFGVKNVTILPFKNGTTLDSERNLDQLITMKVECFEAECRRKLTDQGYTFQEHKPAATGSCSVDLLSQQDHDGVILLNRLLPKNIDTFQPIDVVCLIDFRSHSVQLECLQKEKASGFFPTFPFSVQMSAEKLSIRGRSNDTHDAETISWMQKSLIGKLHRWMESSIPTDPTGTSTASLQSLDLVDDLEEYNCLLNKLKQKYGQAIVSIWTECTDPQKFVYEDIAIATYLLILWKQERAKNGTEQLQTFVDVGCGNGLLVYILTSEGHRGYGVDMRMRKLWNLFPPETKVDLRVETIVPSDACLFPTSDWIIGNHTDELSAWVPVFAARSSYGGRFFLLPCCTFDFDGCRYQRQNCSLSQYGDFLNYTKQIARVCGYHVEVDRLRIPSTKRICLIGSNRTYPEQEHKQQDAQIKAFIEERTKTTKAEEQSEDICRPNYCDPWLGNFKARESVQKVRNCTQIDRSVVDKIVTIVFEQLLAKRRIPEEFTELNWNAGGTIELETLAKSIPQAYLTILKSECGGLQTLLRNNSHIFQVEKGSVMLRIPTKIKDEVDAKLAQKMKRKPGYKPINFKQRACWFFANHPESCPLPESDCRFKHGD
ncbi:probable tRNA (uracil-O(2)-)-methyltransferase [Anopheles maculipalpis]|uniref:probable tRNA (uracil-O(2)-)-methyltransferase n=1 Tax=Anopheles maculipalpis TaxID=1496333 RepID=UPI00215909A5|nr:probable tRNA (uracil-O(2)-)-methyltransferase [Anopheles maculipalpis]